VGQAWPTPDLAAAESQSAHTGRAVVVQADAQTGQYTLLRSGEPASYALRIDTRRAVPWAEWPLAPEGPVRVELMLGERAWVLQPGRTAQGPLQMQAHKRLASDSQAFDLGISRSVAWAELPWLKLLLWCAAAAVAASGLAAWQRQRDAVRRARELLRLGQVGRLNALGEMAAGMAHELNQPLTAVLASTQAAQRLLDDDEPDLATARHALTQSAQQARRAADVVSRLRRLVQAPDADAAPQTLHLADRLRSVLDLMQPQAQGVQLDLSGLDESVHVRADAVALEQVLHNLLLNAQQALEDVPAAQRRLTVACRAEGGLARLTVQDNGPGFAPDALARAFEPFFTTRAGGLGLGLGLSLCDTLAAGMGGSLTAYNRADGGAELTLTLPRAA
jgi:C4-dicarboxylate-specific signal transduction histidine kinase